MAATSTSGRRLGRPPATSSAETRERILRVARQRFAVSGYDSTSNKDIADAADITTGAIYHYFGSKRDLYVAVFEEVEEVIFGRFRAAIEGVEGAVAKLDAVLRESVEINRDDSTVAAFYVSVPVDGQRSLELADVVRKQLRVSRAFFAGIVEEGVATGELPDDVSPDVVVNVLLALTSGLARFSTFVGDPEIHAQTTDLVLRMVHGGLFSAPTRSRRRRRRSGDRPAGIATVSAVNETLTLATPDGDMGIHVVRPDGEGPFPVIVFFHHGPGLDGGSKEAMQLLADAGHYVVSHDRYHREAPWYVLTPEMRGDQDAMKRFWGVLVGTTEELVDRDLAAVLDHLRDDPAAADDRPLGCIGYCIGARSVVLAMANHPDRFAAGVALHPSFCTTADPDSPHLRVPDITGELYVAFGSEDRSQSPADNVPFIDAVNAMPDGRGEAEVLDGADHGFAVPGGPNHHEAAADRAYERALALFGRTLAV